MAGELFVSVGVKSPSSLTQEEPFISFSSGSRSWLSCVLWPLFLSSSPLGYFNRPRPLIIIKTAFPLPLSLGLKEPGYL